MTRVHLCYSRVRARPVGNWLAHGTTVSECKIAPPRPCAGLRASGAGARGGGDDELIGGACPVGHVVSGATAYGIEKPEDEAGSKWWWQTEA